MTARFAIRIFFCMLLSAETEVQAQFIFTTNAGTLTVTGFAGTGAANIPATSNGLPVTSIASFAFHDTRPTSLTIPDTVTNIGSEAFVDCPTLTNVTIGNGITNLVDGAFQYSPRLTEVTFGNRIANIGNYAFASCALLTNITIPGSITNIGQSAFDSSGLTSLTISGNNADIGNFAFFRCTNLANVTIASGITNLGLEAFAYCGGLTNVTISSSVSSIAVGAFAACAKLVAINVDSQNAFYSSRDGVLFDKSQTSLIQFPGGRTGVYKVRGDVTSIGSEAFLGAHVMGVLIPNSVTNLGAAAFEDCTDLASIRIPTGISNISGDAFAGCTSLTNIAISTGVASISGVAFFECTALQNITIPGSVTNIGSYAFEACNNLKDVFFAGNAPTSDSSVFSLDTNTTAYYLPGTTGWSSNFAGLPAVLWNPAMLNPVVTNSQFGFQITGTSNIPIVLQASTNLGSAWSSLLSLEVTNGSVFFTEPLQTNIVGRFYRITAP